MKIGILVNTDKHLEAVVGLTNAALSKDHEVALFSMDAGVRLIENSAFTELSKLKGVSVCFCDHDAARFGADKSNVPTEVVCGSQYNNSVMLHEADRAIVL